MATLRTPEEIKEEKYKLKLKREIGIFYFFDSSSRKDSGIPVNYSTYTEYDKDKLKYPHSLIVNNQYQKIYMISL